MVAARSCPPRPCSGQGYPGFAHPSFLALDADLRYDPGPLPPATPGQKPPGAAETAARVRCMHYAVWAAGRARPGRRRDALLRRADALRNHLVVGHTGLVAAGVARAAARGLTPGVGPDDLWAEAQLTLLKAVAHFDPWRGWQLSTYVYRAVYVQLRRQVEACRRRRGPAGTLAADALAADAEAASGFDLLGCGGGADAVDRWIEAADARARTGRALSALPAPLRQTVCDQFGLHGHRERTVREVAARDHTAARRVRRRRAAALERVREALVYA